MLSAHFAPVLSFVIALLVAQPSWSEETCADSAVVPTHRLQTALSLPAGTVRPVVTLTRLQLSPDPTPTVVLDGVILPAKAGEAIRAAYFDVMARLVGIPVAVVVSADDPDRRGRLHGIIQLEGGESLGERILAAGAGLADVSFTPCAARFLAAETRARAEKRGIWQQSRIWTDLNAAATGLPDFVLGRGKVASIGRSGRTTYINFGGNFRTDATVRLRETMTSALIAAGRPPESFSGRMVEVRGWADRRNGLDMDLDSPLALQMPDAASDLRTD
ncbi:thermonuclease family protein [Pleomorphomonas sp. PLEO]|uniref:thermonuclease family protein n=1 Tax=Pleomorphomonas sp. PLEO TaxID=3239306 RepID=UPI00351DEC38